MARYLSRAELSCIAGKYIEMYYALFGISKNDPAPINPEQFANSVLGLNLKMLPLCSDGHILGLTVFQRCSFTATLEDGTKLVEVSPQSGFPQLPTLQHYIQAQAERRRYQSRAGRFRSCTGFDGHRAVRTHSG